MATFANNIRERISEDTLDNVTATVFLAAMLCLFVVNPTGFVAKLLVGAMLAVALAALALELALYGFGRDEESGEIEPRPSKFRGFGSISKMMLVVATLTGTCILIAESIDLDFTLLWACLALGTVFAAFSIAVDRRDPADPDR